MYLVSNEQMAFIRHIVEAYAGQGSGTLREFNERRRAGILLRSLRNKERWTEERGRVSGGGARRVFKPGEPSALRPFNKEKV